MSPRKSKLIGQRQPKAKKMKLQRRQEREARLAMLCQRAASTASETEQQLQPQVWPDADSSPCMSVTTPLPQPPVNLRGCRESGAEVGSGETATRDAWGRPLQPVWECESGTGLGSFVDSFNRSLQVLGTRTADDTASWGAAAVDAPPSWLPPVPYSVAGPAELQLRELQKAMGATDEEMAILQQLGGEGPIWVPVKAEAAAAPPEEEGEEEADITDLDCQRPTPQASSTRVVRGGGEGAAVTGVHSGESPVGLRKAISRTSGTGRGRGHGRGRGRWRGRGRGRCPVAASRAASSVEGFSAKFQGQHRKRAAPPSGNCRENLPVEQRRKRAAPPSGSSGENLLAGYEEKEMVCPSCHRFFLGVSALQQHVRVAHDGRVDPAPVKKSVTAAAISALGSPADSLLRLACPHCRELLVGQDALAAHVAEEHPGSVATTDPATVTAPLNCSNESVGLKTHISTALGGLLDRALGNRLEKGFGRGGSTCLPSLSNRPTLTVLPKLKPRRHPPTSESGSSPSSGQPRRVYNTELVRQLWQQLSLRGPPTARELQAATASADGKFAKYPYVCFYCECRFEQQCLRNRHMGRAHKDEIMTSKSKQEVPEVDQSDGSGGEESDHNHCDNFGTPQEVVEYDRPELLLPQRGHRVARGEETVRQKAMAALRELGVWDLRRKALRGRGHRGAPAGRGRFPPPMETEPHPSPKQEIEAVFVDEETPFMHECVSPYGLDAARDPLSIDEETDVLPNDPLPICDPQSIKNEVPEDQVAVSGFSVFIKEDPDLYLGIDTTDNKVYSNL